MGIENFTFEVIEECHKCELDDRERYWISMLQPEYNKSKGGRGNFGYHHTEDTRKILSDYGKRQWAAMSEDDKQQVVKGQLVGPAKGHVVSESTRQKLRLANVGKQMSEDTKRKISVSNKGKNDNRSHFKPVIAYNESSIHAFNSVKSAAEYFSADPTRVTHVLKGRRKHFRSLSWEYVSVETNGDECSRVGAILSRVEVQGICKDEEIVHTAEMANLLVNDKGMIQLAMRSGQMKSINVRDVREGEVIGEDFVSGELQFKKLPDAERESAPVVGYVAYFKLLNGFEKMLYMTVEEATNHGKKYSQTFKSTNSYIRDSSKWATDFDAMAKKTVLKLLLSRYAPLSVEMQEAIKSDQAVLSEGEPRYVDNEPQSVSALIAEHEATVETEAEDVTGWTDEQINDALAKGKLSKEEADAMRAAAKPTSSQTDNLFPEK